MFLDPGEGARKPGNEGKLPTDPRPGEPGDWGRPYMGLFDHYKAFGPHRQAMIEAVWKLDTDERFDFKALVRWGWTTCDAYPRAHGTTVIVVVILLLL